MQELCDCGCPDTAITSVQQIYRYNPGVATDVPTPPAQNPNSLLIYPADRSIPAMCYPITTDGSGQTYQWNVETQLWV